METETSEEKLAIGTPVSILEVAVTWNDGRTEVFRDPVTLGRALVINFNNPDMAEPDSPYIRLGYTALNLKMVVGGVEQTWVHHQLERTQQWQWTDLYPEVVEEGRASSHLAKINAPCVVMPGKNGKELGKFFLRFFRPERAVWAMFEQYETRGGTLAHNDYAVLSLKAESGIIATGNLLFWRSYNRGDTYRWLYNMERGGMSYEDWDDCGRGDHVGCFATPGHSFGP